jgi:hypothetical protein
MATALQTVPNSPRTPCSLLSSDAALLSLVQDFQPGIAQRLPTPAERERLAALLPHYERALAPADRRAVEETIAVMSLAYPAMRVTEAEANARLDLYVRELSDLPTDILEEACRAALRELTFFPSIAEIRKRASGLAQRAFRLSRIKHLIARHDAEWREPEAELSPEDKAKVADWLRTHGFEAPQAPGIDPTVEAA